MSATPKLSFQSELHPLALQNELSSTACPCDAHVDCVGVGVGSSLPTNGNAGKAPPPARPQNNRRVSKQEVETEKQRTIPSRGRTIPNTLTHEAPECYQKRGHLA
jgi:hypothetical protein